MTKSFTAEEIAENKRKALEKLHAKMAVASRPQAFHAPHQVPSIQATPKVKSKVSFCIHAPQQVCVTYDSFAAKSRVVEILLRDKTFHSAVPHGPHSMLVPLAAWKACWPSLRTAFDFPKSFGATLTEFAKYAHVRPFPSIASLKDEEFIAACAHTPLLPFQTEGILFGISRSGRVLLADEMGLGKTLQALFIAFFYRTEWPLLVVVPSSLVGSWADSCDRFLNAATKSPLRIVAAYDSKALSFLSATTLDHKTVVIVSYDVAVRNSEQISDRHFRVIICDECHYLKNYTSKRTRRLLPVLARSVRLVMLSGTPAISRPDELFVVLNAVNSRLFGAYREFGMRYCGGRRTAFGFDFRGCTNSAELQLILRSTVMIRRTKTEVLHWLPAKIRRLIFVKTDAASSRKCGWSDADCKTFEKHVEQPEESAASSSITADSSYFTQWEAASRSKMPAILRYLGELLQPCADEQTAEEDYTEPASADGDAELQSHVNDDDCLENDGDLDRDQSCNRESNAQSTVAKFLLFAHFKTTLETVEKWLQSKHIRFVKITGETPAIQRTTACAAFQNDAAISVALLSITAASTGLTLTRASVVTFLELFWNPGVLMQAEDRAHRIGQRDTVIVNYLLGKGTFDDVMWPILNRKIATLEAVGLGSNMFGGARLVSRESNHNAICQSKISDFIQGAAAAD